ncbi:hypothetical protein [Xanthobacter oligotrophicus]|uniref:hypothetical protein n=1 Tax=Xanthobacter oligotrophicus TaxID=2607286 RepID=UPI00165D9313|nr:hypothetical protein [Xanthobacter oligotrophicus]MCG5235313.1 hypothetical protein [Xanthobacter oligotrophicus]
MRLVGSKEALIVTNLTADRLREWTGRRGLIAPDVAARGKGTQARFSWRTLLVLRIAATLRDCLHVELEAYKTALATLQQHLVGQPFHALSGMVLVIGAAAAPVLRRPADVRVDLGEPSFVVALQPHLDAISSALHLIEPMTQLPLFPTVAVR